jgi:hypothetical protein
MTARNTFKKIAGAATVVLAIGATALTAAPAQAQSFHFGIGTNNGSGPNVQFGIGNDDHRPGDRPGRYCLSSGQLRGELRDQGYRNVRIDSVGRFRAEATGVKSGWLYRITLDACRGNIIDRDRIRRA